MAERLHAENPEKFGDANHKPEIAIALSRFESFVGFKPHEELIELLKLEPLRQFSSGDVFNDESLRALCKTLLDLPPNNVSELIAELLKAPKTDFTNLEHHDIQGLLARVSEQYSQFDNGNLVAVLLMNYLVLEPGEALCVPADSIHAYLSGDILECMARSDNVLNTGFCPRADRDNIELFSGALTFKPHTPADAYLAHKPSLLGLNGKTKTYDPPFSEFNVMCLELSPKESETQVQLQGPSILVVTHGSGELKISGTNEFFEIREGNVFFAGPEAELLFSTEEGFDDL